MGCGLELEKPRLGGDIALEAIITIEMIGRDVGEHRHVAVEAVGEVDLVARQLQHIDAACGQRIAAEDRQADIAAEQRGDAGGLEDVVDKRGGGRFAVGAGDADDLVRRERRPRLGEQLNVAD
jgi:hypothetical protein